MVALSRVMAIVHFKITMPIRWLAGSSHNMHAVGYDWSARSMGKAIGALHDAMVQMEGDGKKFLDENFVNSIFSKIHVTDDGELEPLEPLVDYMKYYMGVCALSSVFSSSSTNNNSCFCCAALFNLASEEKLTPAVDVKWKILPFDKINAKLFYQDCKENKETTELVLKMAVEVAKCMLKELRDPKKATSDYLTSEDGEFGWGYTTDEEHQACFRKITTNDPAEAPFAALTQQLEQFGRVLGIHASGVGQARIHGDFYRNLNDGNSNGA